MANMNVKARLERIGHDLDEVVKHVVQYHGIPKQDARLIENEATSIAEQATRLVGLALEAQGHRAAHTVLKKVRKALGFTYP